MLLRCLCLLLLSTLAFPVVAQVDNGLCRVAPLGEEGAYTGFSLLADEAAVATVSFGSNDAIVARSVRQEGASLVFSGLICTPTPTLGPDSSISVALFPDDPYPEVSFRLDLRGFNQEAWEAAFGRCPFHFLACSLPGAEVFHQRGWSIGTPVIDDYIQMQAEGFGKQVVSDWSRDWTYAPPIGAYPVAVAGLWNPSQRRYVSYDFHGARLTDNTEKDFGTAYCYRCKDTEQFFCLTWPFGDHYIKLRSPEVPVSCGTEFRLLWSQEMGPDDDPNRFVQEFLWNRYADLLPGVEAMNDLSWLPGEMRLSGFPVPGRLGGFIHETGDDGDRWWAPHVHVAGGVSYFSPVDYTYKTGDTASIVKLESECRHLVTLGKWMDIEGDSCYWWQTPLDGGGAEFFGPGVQTFRHVNGWSSGAALLDYYRNDPTGAADLLPYIDGALRYTRHILYTRNCYPDVPAAQFAWSATPAVTYCLKYYYTFRDDPARRDLAELAHKLARNMGYRYLALWASDNDKLDDLDSSFMMEPNAGLNWLGCACANEIWVYNIAMLYEYVALGDPLMGHYLRGMLERYHEMYQNQLYPRVKDYPSGAFTERFGLYDECAQGKGVRGDFGGLWGGFERLIWPLGSATVRVVCGEKAAMAFNRDGRHTDIDSYRCPGGGNCSFRLVAGGLEARPDEAFDVTITFPFFDISSKPVTVGRDGLPSTLGEDRVVQYPTEASTITVKGLMLGDVVTVGACDDTSPVLTVPLQKLRGSPSADGDSFIARDGFEMLNLARGAFEGIDRNWEDVNSYAGYEPGVKTLFGVPFLLLDPELTQNRVTVPRHGIAYGQAPEYLFVLVGDVRERSRLTIRYEDGSLYRPDLRAAVPVLQGWPPALDWHIDLVMVENKGRLIQAINPVACNVFSITATDKSAGELSETLTVLADRQAEMMARQKLIEQVRTLAPLMEPFSGHIAVLPSPRGGNPRTSPLVRMLQEAGLAQHLVFLSKEDLVDGRVFNAQNVWIALYMGGEDYYQTVHTEGDGDAALRSWLQAGGTLVSLSQGPFPFYTNEKDKPVVSAPDFGFPISGSGHEKRLDTLDVASVTGWETPPEGLELSFHVNPEQEVISGLPASFPWPEDGDQRWRPILDVVDEGNVYTPIVTLRDREGRQYGEAAAMIDYKVGELAGARVLYVWSSLHTNRLYRHTIITDILRYLLSHTMPPVAQHTCFRAAEPPTIDGKLDDAIWRQAEATAVFARLDDKRDDGASLRTTAKMAWDDEALYVAWECEDPDIWSDITDRDGNLWEGEVVEIYIDPDGDGREYLEIELSPLGNVVDLRIPQAVDGVPQNLEDARKWDAEGLRSAVDVQGTLDNREDVDTGWTAEMAIPLRNFTGAENIPPRIGDTWRVQLYRIEQGACLPNPQFSSWSVTDTFHNPERFGRVVFAASPYHDDFSGYEPGAAPRPTWTVTGGQWQVVGGELVGTSSGTGAWTPTGAVAGSESWTDYRLSLRFRALKLGGDHRDGAWIGFRYQSPQSCYSLNFRNGLVLHKAYMGRTGGDHTALARAEWANDGNWHKAVVTVRGNQIAVEVDGRQVMGVTDEDFLGVGPVPSGGVCLSARRWEGSPQDTVVAFDDVQIEPL